MTRYEPCAIDDLPGERDPDPGYAPRDCTCYVLCDDGYELAVTVLAFDDEDAEQMALHEARCRMMRPVRVVDICWEE